MNRLRALSANACLTLGLFGFPGSQAMAQNSVDCTGPQTQIEMTYCAEQDWNAADADLNAVYKTAMGKMHEVDSYLSDSLKGAADALRDAQRAWITYRDKACAAYGYLARGGTMEPQLIYICRANLTRERTKELKDLAEGLGN